MNLGHAIKVCRDKRHISQKELAETAGVSVSHLCLIEKGKREASLSTVEALSEAMKVPVSILIFLATEKEELIEAEGVDLDRLTNLMVGLISDDTA